MLPQVVDWIFWYDDLTAVDDINNSHWLDLLEEGIKAVMSLYQKSRSLWCLVKVEQSLPRWAKTGYLSNENTTTSEGAYQVPTVLVITARIALYP